MTSKTLGIAAEPRNIRPFTCPAWMTRGEKKQFRSIVHGRIEAGEQLSDAELDRIGDYVASRARIATLREILRKDQDELARGSQLTSTKSRVLQTSRQLDTAEKQSHALAESIGLL